MKQQKDTPGVSQWRYWTTAPETVDVPAALLEPLVPAAHRRAPFPSELLVRLPAAEILRSNVPRLKLSTLEELLPNHVRAKGGESIVIPAQQLARFYSLVEHAEEIVPPEPEVTPEPVVELLAEAPAAPDVPVNEPPVESLAAEMPAEAPEKPSAEKPAAAEPWVDPALKYTPKPGRGSGLFGGLPIFRRRSEESPPPPEDPPAAPAEAVELPPRPASPVLPPKPRAILPPLRAIPVIRPPRPAGGMVEIPPPPASAPETPVSISQPEPEITPQQPPEPEIPLPPPPEPAVAPGPVRAERDEPPIPTPIRPVRVLETEAVSERSVRRDIPDEEGLQALFLTEERLTVPRVVELCGGLPGINSCVLTHGSMVITAHNAPTNVDLISLSAHAADMLRGMRESTARMGVGMVPAVTLHTEKGVISFFSREDLTMLVFHKDRGFVPGVREKIAAALGELTKANLTLPAGDPESGK